MEFKVSKNTTNRQSCLLSVSFDCLSIRRLLQQHLWFLLNLSLNPLNSSFTSYSIPLSPRQIPLYRLKNQTKVVYRSSIAFQLGRENPGQRLKVANQILNRLSWTPKPKLNQTILQFIVQVIEPGWIDFHLSDRSLAIWLAQLIYLPHIPPQGDIAITDNLFPLQYAHSRCCSLLRLGHQHHLIELRNQDLSQPNWQWAKPDPIPWFSSSSGTRLRFVHTTEWFLMIQLLEIVDQFETCLEGDSKINLDWVKLGTTLSVAMLNFYDHCRIWGEIQTTVPELSQARLGLIALTQWVLRWLLQVQLKRAAILEL